MSHHRRWMIVASFAMASVQGPLGAQILDQLPPGAPVRIWTDEIRGQQVTLVGRHRGSSNFVTTTGDTLIIADDVLRGLEIQRGRYTARGAGIGAVVGGLLGGLIGGAIGNAAVSGCTEFLCELDAIGYAAGGFLGGAVVGAALGAAGASPRWQPVSLNASSSGAGNPLRPIAIPNGETLPRWRLTAGLRFGF